MYALNLIACMLCLVAIVLQPYTVVNVIFLFVGIVTLLVTEFLKNRRLEKLKEAKKEKKEDDANGSVSD